jgi:hypothetical protein
MTAPVIFGVTLPPRPLQGGKLEISGEVFGIRVASLTAFFLYTHCGDGICTLDALFQRHSSAMVGGKRSQEAIAGTGSVDDISQLRKRKLHKHIASGHWKECVS